MTSTLKSKGKRKAVVESSDEEGLGDHLHDEENERQVNIESMVFPHSRSEHTLDDSAEAIQLKLGTWFDGVHDARRMPWRKRWDPSLDSTARAQRAYEVWVSEIMLQQTRVETVIPYYNKWMEAFPTVESLSQSNIEAVNALWKGLGYYSRAARLYEGSKIVTSKFDGKLPDDIDVLQAQVPGIGRYSAGAICSIAYGKQVPVLDGNVNRLLSRILALHANPKGKATLDILWQAAEDIVENSTDPGAINQGLIELGSTICTPKDPKCGDCPVNSECRAYKWKTDSSVAKDIEECDICVPIPKGPRSVTVFPMKVEKKAVPEQTDVVCIVSWSHKKDLSTVHYLLRKRPKSGLLAGLWDFPVVPNISKPSEGSFKSHSRQLVKKAFPQLGDEEGDSITIKSVEPLGSVLHVFSHVKKTFQAVAIKLESSDEEIQPPNAIVGDWMDDVEVKEKEEKVKRPAKKRKVTSDENGDEDERLKWVLEANVAQENLGTGTMKVWALVQGDAPKPKKAKAKAQSQTAPANVNKLDNYFTKTRK